jgi:gluconate 5-dehydrogenase
MFDLTGKRALVTGSSRGLGYVIARGLGNAGAKLVLNARSEERLRHAVESLRAGGLDVEGHAFDVTDGDAVESAVAAIENDGPIDILVSNAGIQKRAALVDMTEAEWREVIDTNLTSCFLVGQAVGKRMLRREAGKIIITCSLMSEIGRPTIANYAAAKGGLRMLIRSMTVEWAKHNIQINGIGPGYFLTDLTRVLHDDPAFNSWICNRTPAGRWGDPEELVGPTVFLASDASSYVNGQIIYIDGGILAGL